MKFLIALALMACGDNIIPPPDGSAEDSGWVWVEPPFNPDFARPDAGAPPEELPVCADKHLPKHPHKCRHTQRAH